MKYLPLFFDLRGKRALVVGGGEVAQRKVEMLARAGCAPRVVAPRIRPQIEAAAAAAGGEVARRAYRAADMAGCALAVAATDDDKINRRVFADGRKRRTPVNVVDCAPLCDFIFPALVDRGDVVAAVSSSGASPVLARRLRERVEAALPAGAARLCEWCDARRARAAQALPRAGARRLFWESIIDGAAAERAMAGDADGAEAIFERALAAAAAQKPIAGAVHLIGAGPGDPELLTLKGARLLRRADAVVYDRLAAREVVDLARRDAERFFVGKQSGRASTTQAEINRLLIRLARAGKIVARLKGGDPLVFGRGGEEAICLARAGIECRIVPGVTAAVGGAAAADIPLTHRLAAGGARILMARRRDMLNAERWRRLARDLADGDTLAFYMAGKRARAVARNLLLGGADADTPFAVVSAATTPAQSVATTSLAAAAAVATRATAPPVSPTILIVGRSVALRAQMRPLAAREEDAATREKQTNELFTPVAAATGC